MRIDYKKYKHYRMLEELLPIAQKDKDVYMQSGHDTHKIARINEMKKHNMGEDEVLKWHIIPVLRNSEVTEYAFELPNVLEKVKQIPGVVNCTLNIYSPGGDSPIHTDDGYDTRPDLIGFKKCLAVLLCVDIPSTNIDECGFQIADEKIVHKTGDFIGFDGSIPHGSWNNTPNYRFTMNVDIELSYWDNA